MLTPAEIIKFSRFCKHIQKEYKDFLNKIPASFDELSHMALEDGHRYFKYKPAPNVDPIPIMLYCVNLNIDIKHENELIRKEDPMNDSKWHILDI